MIDDVQRVLEFIVNHYVVRDEVLTIDRDASIVPDGRSIEVDKQHAVRREADHAHSLAEPFNTGLLLAWRRKSLGGTELLLDDRNDRENAVADALIQFLVRFDLATSRTEETDPLHYTYYLTVDWDKLFDLASSIDSDLKFSLTRHLHEIDER